MSEAQKVYVLHDAGYEHDTIVGIFDSEEAAHEERERIEQLWRAHDRAEATARKLGRGGDQLSVTTHVLNHSRAEVIVRVRGDGTVTETHVHLHGDGGYRYEPIFEGRARTFEEAEAFARKAASDSLPDAETNNGNV